MLDFALVQRQINEMVLDQKSARRSYDEKISLANETLQGWGERWKELAVKLQQSRTSWLLAGQFYEPFTTRYPVPERPELLTVVATDGSQIFPDRHELSSCHLLNVGTVVLHYGSGERPVLTSRPVLYYKDRDTFRDWNGNRVPVNSEMISALRGALEIQELAGFAEEAAEEDRRVIGLTDGTLILWSLEGKPKDFQREILNFYLTSFEQMRRLGLPFMGYISQPGSADVVNVLRVALCPENPTNCDRCPYKGSDEELPCEPIAGVTDGILFSTILQEGERSTVFKSSSEILKEYGKQAVFFFYLHVGWEIVRIEIPQWLAENYGLLNLTHAVAYDQARKGQGYPVSLAEAHERAVIRGNEREQFYRIIENRYVREGLKVSISRKSFKKRHVNI
ncbi:MAG: DNA double-strand break repair nuclease NurA [bacterium]|nr:DNA double-strand break repair nuclease NurA [bacterium]